MFKTLVTLLTLVATSTFSLNTLQARTNTHGPLPANLIPDKSARSRSAQPARGCATCPASQTSQSGDAN